MLRSSKLCSITGNITGWPHLVHSEVANGGKSPGMNVFTPHLPHVTIFKDLDSPPFIAFADYHGRTAPQVHRNHLTTASQQLTKKSTEIPAGAVSLNTGMSASTDMTTLARREAELDAARELRWVVMYSELTGASESQARGCWMYLSSPSETELQLVPLPLDAPLPSLA